MDLLEGSYQDKSDQDGLFIYHETGSNGLSFLQKREQTEPLSSQTSDFTARCNTESPQLHLSFDRKFESKQSSKDTGLSPSTPRRQRKKKKLFNQAEDNISRREFLARNRAAASKSRQRKKEWIDKLLEKQSNLSEQNKILKSELRVISNGNKQKSGLYLPLEKEGGKSKKHISEGIDTSLPDQESYERGDKFDGPDVAKDESRRSFSSDSGIGDPDGPLFLQDQPLEDDGFFSLSPCSINPVRESLVKWQDKLSTNAREDLEKLLLRRYISSVS